MIAKKIDLNMGQKFSSPSKRRPIKDPWSLCVMQKALRAKHLSSYLLAALSPMPDQTDNAKPTRKLGPLPSDKNISNLN